MRHVNEEIHLHIGQLKGHFLFPQLIFSSVSYLQLSYDSNDNPDKCNEICDNGFFIKIPWKRNMYVIFRNNGIVIQLRIGTTQLQGIGATEQIDKRYMILSFTQSGPRPFAVKPVIV